MESEINKRLLKNKKVIEEIDRHRWIESERAGYDIGFEKASIEWLEKFSTAWMQYHMPDKKTPSNSLKSPSVNKPSVCDTSQNATDQAKIEAKSSQSIDPSP